MGKQKFKVGDMIKANEESNYCYGVTTKRNDWEGEVIGIFGQLIRVRTTKFKEDCEIGEEFTVNPKYFDFLENKEEILEKTNDLKAKIKEILKERV